MLVEATLRFDPFSRNLFRFTNKQRNQIKVLYWQRSGFCLWKKRLKEEKFKWPVHLPPEKSDTARPLVVTLDEEQFLWLLAGLDLKHLTDGLPLYRQEGILARYKIVSASRTT